MAISAAPTTTPAAGAGRVRRSGPSPPAGQDAQGHAVDAAARLGRGEAQLEGHVGSKSRMRSHSAAAREARLDGQLGRDLEVVGDVTQGGQGRQTDELRLAQLDALGGGEGAHGLPHQPERCHA